MGPLRHVSSISTQKNGVTKHLLMRHGVLYSRAKNVLETTELTGFKLTVHTILMYLFCCCQTKLNNNTICQVVFTVNKTQEYDVILVWCKRGVHSIGNLLNAFSFHSNLTTLEMQMFR